MKHGPGSRCHRAGAGGFWQAAWPVNDDEMTAVMKRADELSRADCNRIWLAQQSAPYTVAYRDYLAMTLRFSELGKTPETRMGLG